MIESQLNFPIQVQEAEHMWPTLVIAEKERLEAEGYTVTISSLGEMIVTTKKESAR